MQSLSPVEGMQRLSGPQRRRTWLRNRPCCQHDLDWQTHLAMIVSVKANHMLTHPGSEFCRPLDLTLIRNDGDSPRRMPAGSPRGKPVRGQSNPNMCHTCHEHVLCSHYRSSAAANITRHSHDSDWSQLLHHGLF